MKQGSMRPEGSRGQVLVLVAMGFLGLVLGVAVVVDGGNAFAQQRASQNAADAAAEAGTTVVAQYLMTGLPPTLDNACPTGTADPWDVQVCNATYGVAADNGVTLTVAQYTDYKGDPIGTVGGGSMPSGAQGVQVVARRQFGTYFARAAGIDTWNADTQATAITGSVSELCPPGTPCGLFPITVPTSISACDKSGKVYTPNPGDPWPYLGDDETNTGNEAIVPVCKNQNNDIGGGSAGSVGWLDLATAIGVTTTGTCHSQFKDAITDPCIVSMKFPTWVQTFPGGVGKGGPEIQDALNSLHDSTVQIPLFDGTCKVKPGGTALSDCPAGEIGVGANTWYHVPFFASFKLDYFYISGNDRKECGKSPGSPYVDGNGANGCFKGWWVVALVAPGQINPGAVTPSISNQLGVQLWK